MNIKYIWRNTVQSESIEDLMTKKLEKLEKHADHVTEVQVTLETINKQEHTVKASLHIHHTEIHAHATATDMYKAIDDMVHKVIRQVETHKAKSMEHRNHNCQQIEEL